MTPPEAPGTAAPVAGRADAPGSAGTPPAPVPAAGAPAGGGTVLGAAAGAPAGGGAVLGDGTGARDRARTRWRRWRWPVAVALLVVLLAVVAALLPEPPRSTTPLAPDNPDEQGARAVARILEREGVEVVHVRTTADALAAARLGGTLLVTGTGLLGPEQVEAVAGTDVDLVLLEPDDAMLAEVTDAATAAPGGTAPTDRAAACPDPDAAAAGTVRTAAGGFRALTEAATVCFPAPDAEPGTGVLLVVEAGRRITALGDAGLLTNERLADAGHAALTLRVLGRHDRLVWYVPAVDDLGGSAPTGPSLGDLLPPWAGVVALQLGVVVVAAALWRGRRLGPLVTEPLPVVVPAAETTRGRGRLYRRSRAYGHAAAALRAGTARRAAARLGLPRSAGAPAVIEALARATGRPADHVAALLYGPPPTDDAGLTALARRLDDLESEVHRP